MDDEAKSTKPKPFVFVLMPFDPSFDDIYKFGIKGAAEDAGAYTERIDDQIFREGILDRVFNQINKADVVVADMTGRNPNVFYEVSDAVQGLARQYRLGSRLPSLPPGTFDTFGFLVSANSRDAEAGEENVELRLHTNRKNYRYAFRLAFGKQLSE